MFRRPIALATALAAIALGWTGQGIAAAQAAPAPVPAQAQAADLSDPTDVKMFLDGTIAIQMAAHHIAGVSVAVVKDGKVVLTRGYGYADWAKHTPVDGETMFRPGSISKLFTWTAVMQQVEQGKIDLNADVNTYLKAFQIPPAFGKPITMLNLMTHTPGFEDSARDLFVGKPEQILTLEDYLKNHIPARIYPPGAVAAYSNYGATLAGYIVQEVSGEPFDSYVEKHIFTPLGMTHSTFRQPLPDELKTSMTDGYYVSGGLYTAKDFELANVTPAGSLSSTAGDMANFMLAHLGDGSYNGAQILKPETAKLMHSQAWTPSPDIQGMAHGFYLTAINGQRIIEHGGDTLLFHSELMLIPEQGAGLYVSYNSSTGSAVRTELMEAFMDRYFPAEKPALKPPADFKDRLAGYVGTYGMARTNITTTEKITMLMQNFTVSPGSDDTLMITSLRTPGWTDQWVEVKPGVFRLVGGEDTVVFLDQAGGQYQTAYMDSMPMIALVRLPWYDTGSFGVALLGVCLVLFLTGILAAPVGLFGPRVKPPDPEPSRLRRRLARWVGFGFCLLTIGYVVWFVLAMNTQGVSIALDFTPMDQVIWVARAAILVALAMTGLGYFVWREKYWSLAGRIHYTLLVLAAWAFVAFEAIWKLV